MTRAHHRRHRHDQGASRPAAAATLLLVLTGPPSLLLRLLGNPLRLPAPLRSPHVLTGQLDDATLLWLLAALAWLLWLHLLGTLVVEALRQTRGSSLRMPLPGLLFGAHTLLASHLIATLLLPNPAPQPGALTPATPRPAAAVSRLVPTGGHPPLPLSALAHPLPTHRPEPAPPPGAAPAVAGGIECRVLPPHGRHHDTLWDIATRHLGDGTRWREIYALNDGRMMPDGQRLTRASLIRPGWILRLPPDAILLDQDRVPDPAESARPAPRATEPAPEVGAPDGAAATRHGAPALPTPHAAAADTGEHEPTTSAAATATPTARSTAQHPHRHRDDQRPDSEAVVELGTLTLAAVGLLAALTRRRKIAARRRPLGVRHAPPAPEVLAAEGQLRRQARQAEDVAATVRLALLLATPAMTPARVVAVWQHPDGSLELVLDPHTPDVPAPVPFEPTERGWRLPSHAQRYLFATRHDGAGDTDRSARLSHELAATPDPFPALLPVGEQDGSACLVNLEPLGLISLLSLPAAHATPDPAAGPAGDPGRQPATQMLAAWMQALAGAPWAERVQLYVPAAWAELATGLERVRCIDLHHPGDGPAPLAGQDRAQLRDQPSLEAARRADTGCAQLVSTQLTLGFRTAEVPDWLLTAATDPLDPNLVLLDGPHPHAHIWQLRADGTLCVPGIADRLAPLRLDRDQQALLRRLLEHAEDPPHADPHDRAGIDPAPTDTTPEATVVASAEAEADPAAPPPGTPHQAPVLRLAPTAPTGPAAADEDAPDEIVDDAVELEPGPVEVAILGPLEIRGAADPRPRQQSMEMLVYLALHRQPVTLEGLSNALWPDRPFLDRTVRNRMSDLRPYIHRRLEKLPGSRYRLTDLVVTDWQRFRTLSEGNPSQQLAALALVRGIPFTGLSLDWYHLDGLLGEIEASIVDLALHVADSALRQRDYDRARTAALAGLRGCPYEERLYRVAMQSAAARGATGELHQLRRQLAYVLDDELEPDDSIQPATEQLYRALRDQPAGPSSQRRG